MGQAVSDWSDTERAGECWHHKNNYTLHCTHDFLDVRVTVFLGHSLAARALQSLSRDSKITLLVSYLYEQQQHQAILYVA